MLLKNHLIEVFKKASLENNILLKENIVLKWVHRFGIDSLNDLLIHSPVQKENHEEENQEQITLIDENHDFIENNKPSYETIISQEAWIDDSTPEDVAVLIERLRSAGAIDVICYSVDMKKNRKGICIQAIVYPKHKNLLREVWFNYSTTIGIRENKISRWILPRRIVSHKTKFGTVNVKQAMRPNGQNSIKIEHKDLTRITLNTGIPIEEIRQKLIIELSEFYEIDDWSF